MEFIRNNKLSPQKYTTTRSLPLTLFRASVRKVSVHETIFWHIVNILAHALALELHKFSSVQRTNYTAIESMIINQNGCCSFHYRNSKCVSACVCAFAFAWPCSCNKLAINFSYRRTFDRVECVLCVVCCALELLYKLINRTLGTCARECHKWKRNGTERSIIMVFLRSDVDCSAARKTCDAKHVCEMAKQKQRKKNKRERNEFIAKM